ncbi:MAG: hypothetical protein LUH21_00605 [Clostridiales bacterium]|nr:hypothetical protein [Clostridiales bacterium]
MKKRGNRVLAGLLAVLVVLGAVPVQTMGAQYGIQKNKYLDVKKTPTGKTGQNMTISMIFDNSRGSEDLQGVSVRFDDSAVDSEYDAAEDPDEETRYNGSIFPFEITSSIFDAKVIGSVKAGATKTVSLSARVRRDIAEGYYSVPIIVKANGSDATTDHINVWITKSSGTTESGDDEGSIRFELGENQSTPSGQYPDVMNFTVNLRNASNITAFDVNVRMGLSEDSTKFPFNINDGNYVRHFDRVGGGETQEVSYSMAIRKEAYTGYYPITFTIEYRDSTEGDIQKAESIFYVHVQNKDKEEETKEFNANDRTRARLIVDGFQTNPEVVYVGDEFDLILRMKNASENVAASNILFTLESEKVTDSAVFTTDSGSSSIVVNSLAAGQSTELKIRMRAGAWVDQRTYAITINEKYDSPEYKNAEEKVTVDIPVKQMARLNTGTIEVMPDTMSVGAESNVMFPINNTGKVLLYNVMVTFVGDSIQQTDSYVGNIKPGESKTVDAMVSGVTPTTDDGKVKILITYEDENGVVSDPIEKEMTLMVTEEMEPEDGMLDDMGAFPADTEPAGIKKYQKFLIPGIIAVLVIATAAAVVVLKKRKKKKEAEEEDIDDEI